MIQTTTTHPEFELLAREFLAQHSEVPHTWQEIHDISGGRTDLVCWPDTAHDVFASLSDSHITIGGPDITKDFETFGRGLSQEDLAKEALALLVNLIEKRIVNDA